MKKHLQSYPGYQLLRNASLLLRQITLQTTREIPIIRLSDERFKSLQKKAAYAIYTGAKPFSLYEKIDMREFLHDLEIAFNPPSARLVRGRLLDKYYEKMWKKVLAVML
jgi:hypothetical protein